MAGAVVDGDRTPETLGDLVDGLGVDLIGGDHDLRGRALHDRVVVLVEHRLAAE
jgi:hypothetical protein